MNHEYWYLSRAAGFTAYGLLFVSVALGIVIGTRLTRRFARNVAYDMHRFTSILALGFTAFHVLILLGDGYFEFSVWQLFVPFLSPYRTWQTAAGVFGLYLLVIVVASFWIRRFIGYRAWRTLHLATFALFGLATLHGITAGTDTTDGWARAIYLLVGAATAALLAYRVQHDMPETRRAQLMRGAAGVATAGAAAWMLFGTSLLSPGSTASGRPVGNAIAAVDGDAERAVLASFAGELTGQYSETGAGNTAHLVLDASASGDLPVNVHVELLQLLTRSDDDGDDEEEAEEEDEHEDERHTTIARNVAQLIDPGSGDLLCDGSLTALDRGYIELSCNGVGPYDGLIISIESEAQVNRDGTLSGTLSGTMTPQS